MPSPLADAVRYISAFYTLHDCRQYGMSANPISMVDIKAYIDTYNIENVRDFVYYIKVCDNAYLKYVSEKDA